MKDLIIPTNGITGNIGSCKTEITQAPSQRLFYKQEYVVYATNSCTGVIEKYDTFNYEAWPTAGFVGGGLICFLITMGVLGAIFKWGD